MYSKETLFAALGVLVCSAGIVASCGTQKKLEAIVYDGAAVPEIRDKKIPEVSLERRNVMRDTLKIKDATGQEMFLMKAIVDEATGERVASEVLEEAVVTARFRHVAERGGKVDLHFEIVVPPSVMDSRWQVQLTPVLFSMGDSLRLDPIVVTGQKYREAQLRAYQRYESLIASIITDPNAFLERRNLEIFFARNLPEVYAMRSDSSYVSDDRFATIFGLDAQAIVDHYSYRARIKRNEQKKQSLTRMHDQLKSFLEKDGIRLDTVIVDGAGQFVYEYVQTVKTRPGLKKVDISLSGEVLDRGNVVYVIPRGEPYTFYISSTSSLLDPQEKYISKVIERRVASNLFLNIDFDQGSSVIIDTLGNNARDLDRGRTLLNQLVQDEVFDLDSVVITASCSPEGALSLNERLSRERSLNVTAYYQTYLDALRNRLDEESDGQFYDENGQRINAPDRRISLLSRSIGEDWRTLDILVATDTVLTDTDKQEYSSYREIKDVDHRERLMYDMSAYSYIKDSLYPRLRRVKFDFYLHRKGMVKDTMVTTVVDSSYKKGIIALENMDYSLASKILAPYKDYNTAVAFVGDDRNYGAMEILKGLPATPSVHYLLAIVCSRLGNQQEAVEHYMTACRMDGSYVARGNLDPEISELISVYGLNKDDDF